MLWVLRSFGNISEISLVDLFMGEVDRRWNSELVALGKVVNMKNSSLIEQLKISQSEMRPIGFSPWKEGDKNLWGFVMDIDDAGVWFLEISTLGKINTEPEYWFWSELMDFDFENEYAQRLIRFGDIETTLPEMGKWRRSAKDRDRILREGIEGDRLVQIWKPDDTRLTVLPIDLDGGFLVFSELDNACREHSKSAIRLSLIKAVREYDGMIEAETWLWRQHREAEEA